MSAVSSLPCNFLYMRNIRPRFLQTLDPSTSKPPSGHIARLCSAAPTISSSEFSYISSVRQCQHSYPRTAIAYGRGSISRHSSRLQARHRCKILPHHQSSASPLRPATCRYQTLAVLSQNAGLPTIRAYQQANRRLTGADVLVPIRHSAARHTATAYKNLSLPARLPHKSTNHHIALPFDRLAHLLYLRPVHCSKSSTSLLSLSCKPSMTFSTFFHFQNYYYSNVGPKRLGSFIASVSVTLGVIMPPLSRRERKAPATVPHLSLLSDLPFL